MCPCLVHRLPEPVNVISFGKSFKLKDCDTKSSWIIWEGPKFNDRCPYKRDAKETCG